MTNQAPFLSPLDKVKLTDYESKTSTSMVKLSPLLKSDFKHFIEYKQLQRATIPILIALAVSNVLYTFLQAFYPLYMETNFPNLTSVHFALILAMFEVCQLITCMVLGKYIPEKRKTFILYAFVLEMFATASFSLFVYLESDQYILFFVLSLILRGLQGIGSAIIMTCAYSYATNEMGKEKDRYIGYLETSSGGGDVLGPAIGGLAFAYLGYAGTFMLFSACIYLGIILSVLLIPSSLNKRVFNTNSDITSQQEQLLSSEDETDQCVQISPKDKQTITIPQFEKLTLKKIITNLECFITILAMFFSVVFCLFNESILALALKNKFNQSNLMIGLCFTLGSFSYMISSAFMGVISQYLNRRSIIQLGFSMMILQNFLLGPSALIGLEQNPVYIYIGMFLMGGNLVFAMVPTLAEIIDILAALNKYDPLEINDLSVSIFNSMYSLSNLMAPIAGGVLNFYFGYEWTCNILAFSAFGFAILFYTTMILGKIIKK